MLSYRSCTKEVIAEDKLTFIVPKNTELNEGLLNNQELISQLYQMNPTELLNLACVSAIRAKNMIEEKQNVLVQAQADLSKA